jgi:hypothetical protein
MSTENMDSDSEGLIHWKLKKIPSEDRRGGASNIGCLSNNVAIPELVCNSGSRLRWRTAERSLGAFQLGFKKVATCLSSIVSPPSEENDGFVSRAPNQWFSVCFVRWHRLFNVFLQRWTAWQTSRPLCSLCRPFLCSRDDVEISIVERLSAYLKAPARKVSR